MAGVAAVLLLLLVACSGSQNSEVESYAREFEAVHNRYDLENWRILGPETWAEVNKLAALLSDLRDLDFPVQLFGSKLGELSNAYETSLSALLLSSRTVLILQDVSVALGGLVPAPPSRPSPVCGDGSFTDHGVPAAVKADLVLAAQTACAARQRNSETWESLLNLMRLELKLELHDCGSRSSLC